jgi:hypothetical protein
MITQMLGPNINPKNFCFPKFRVNVVPYQIDCLPKRLLVVDVTNFAKPPF